MSDDQGAGEHAFSGQISPDSTSRMLECAREFRLRPFGHHSPELQRLLHVLRSLPIPGKEALVSVVPNREWMLVTLTGEKDRPFVRHQDQTFTDLAEAEWAVFKLRWKRVFGGDLRLEDEIENDNRIR
ncbi:hypothetical protein [Mesorhizobium sp. 128a]